MMEASYDRDRSMRRFARNLRRQLELSGMSQKELSVRAGVTEAAISNYVGCRREPCARSLARLARALGCTVDDLLEGVA